MNTQQNPPPTIRLAGVERQSIVDGPGLRYTIFTQGCSHACPGCHNPDTWSFEGGHLWKVEQLLTEIDKNPLLSGVTFSGGEPLERPGELLPLAQGIKDRNLNIVCFTGFTFEELVQRCQTEEDINQLLPLIDILIDGRFEIDQKDLRLRFRGSHNQRILDLPASLKKNRPVVMEEYM